MAKKIVNCKYCQAEIIFVKTSEGKALPCDPNLLPYKAGGYERLLTEDGKMVKGYLHYAASEDPDGMAYRLHFATCPHERERKREQREQKTRR